MPQKLTDTAVKMAKPKERPYKLTDGGGLYVFVTPSGGKLWRLKYRFDKKEKLLSLHDRLRAVATQFRLADGT